MNRADMMWSECESNFLVAGKNLRFLLCHMIQPRNTGAQETEKNRAAAFSSCSFLLLTWSWQHRDRMRISGKGISKRQKEKQICCKLQLICGKTANATQIWFHSAAVVPGPSVNPWASMKCQQTMPTWPVLPKASLFSLCYQVALSQRSWPRKGICDTSRQQKM